MTMKSNTLQVSDKQYQVKTQYLQLKNMVDTSIKHPISGQSSTVVKGCVYILFDMVDTAFSCGTVLIV